MPMMTTPNLKFVDSPKTQESQYLENEILFSPQMKKISYHRSRAVTCQNIVFQQN